MYTGANCITAVWFGYQGGREKTLNCVAALAEQWDVFFVVVTHTDLNSSYIFDTLFTARSITELALSLC